MNEEIENTKFDLLVYRKQYEYCKEAIENGNWYNYSDSLKIRKEKLQNKGKKRRHKRKRRNNNKSRGFKSNCNS